MAGNSRGAGRIIKGLPRGIWLAILFQVVIQISVTIPLWVVHGHPPTRAASIAAAIITTLSAIILFGLIVLARSGLRRTKGRLAFYWYILIVTIVAAACESAAVFIFPAERHSAERNPAWASGTFSITIVVIALITTVIYSTRAPAFASFLDFLTRRVFRAPLAPSFGFVAERLTEVNLQGAFPSSYPPGEWQEFQGTGSTEDLSRAAAWANEIAREDSQRGPGSRTPRPYATTIGFVRFRDEGIKLAVINYFRPRHLFRARLASPATIAVAGEEFPVVARPWLPTLHRGNSAHDGHLNDGHLWVTFGTDPVRYGIVTARHLVSPANAEPGSDVRAHSLRSTVSGILRQASTSMDAALIEITEETEVPKLNPAPHTKIVAYKPVRLCTGRHPGAWPTDGEIKDTSGFYGGTIYFKDPGGEPINRALMIFDVHGEWGDCGCMVLDCEPEIHRRTAMPYVMYQGVIHLGSGTVAGLGILLDQIYYHWPFDTHCIVPPTSDQLEDEPLGDPE